MIIQNFIHKPIVSHLNTTFRIPSANLASHLIPSHTGYIPIENNLFHQAIVHPIYELPILRLRYT